MSTHKRFMSISDLAVQPPPSWCVEKLFENGTLAMISGAPATFKTFLIIDIMMCLTLGKPWNGRRTLQQNVLYLPGEGKSNLLKRLDTWMSYHHITPEERAIIDSHFRVSFDVPQLASKPSVDNLLADLKAEGWEPKLIVIDTLARSFVGMDENVAKDAGMWVDQADRLRSLGYTVVVLHHTAKNTENGVKTRGSSAFLGAMDTAMIMTRSASNQITLTVTKQKDHDEGDPMTFNRLIVKQNDSDEGSVILMPVEPMDDRYAAGSQPDSVGVTIDELTTQLVESADYETDQARAQALSEQMGITLAAAKMRISRKTQELSSSNKTRNMTVSVTNSVTRLSSLESMR